MTELQLKALDKIYQILYQRGLETEKSVCPGATNTRADFDETTDTVMHLHCTAELSEHQGFNDETTVQNAQNVVRLPDQHASRTDSETCTCGEN